MDELRQAEIAQIAATLTSAILPTRIDMQTSQKECCKLAADFFHEMYNRLEMKRDSHRDYLAEERRLDKQDAAA